MPVTDIALGEFSLHHITAPQPVAPLSNQWVPYMRSHQKLLFLFSTIVALLAILIQSASEAALPHSTLRLTRPGWAQHRNEGWQ